MRRSAFVCAAFGLARLLVPTAGAAVVVNVTPGVGANAPSAQMLGGFATAANIWSSILSDNITVNVTVSSAALAAGETGVSNPAQTPFAYATVRAALVADAASANDVTAVAHLPVGPAVSLLINRTSNRPAGSAVGTPYVDNNANAKAVGLPVADPTANDGSITFSSTLAFDYDRSNGIAANAIDFVGVATHELGHVLGFYSGVDVLDRNSRPTDLAPDDQFSFVTTMDLFRYSTDSLAQNSLDWTADTRPKFTSIDGGATSLGGLSTGTNYGDGYGDSHWKDNLGLGIMDPTFA